MRSSVPESSLLRKEKHMNIITIETNGFGENCYIVTSDQGNAAVIDPGGKAEEILSYLGKNGLTAKKILLTHGHFDHIAAVWELKQATGAEIAVHELDGEMLTSPVKNLAAMFGEDYRPVAADVLLQDGDRAVLDELVFQVIHTPGHTPGSVCFLVGETLFSGDTLFAGSIGRTDFPNGSYAQISESLKRLEALEGDYTVLSGHGEQTTLDRERNCNPYLRMLRED